MISERWKTHDVTAKIAQIMTFKEYTKCDTGRGAQVGHRTAKRRQGLNPGRPRHLIFEGQRSREKRVTCSHNPESLQNVSMRVLISICV